MLTVYLTRAIPSKKESDPVKCMFFSYLTGYFGGKAVKSKTMNESWGRGRKRGTCTPQHTSTEVIFWLGLFFTTVLKENVHPAAAN